MMCALSFATDTKGAPTPVVCVEQHVSIPFGLGGRVRHSSDTRLSYLANFRLNLNLLRVLLLVINHSLAHNSFTICCSTYLMIRSYPIELRVGYGCRLKPAGSALTQHVIT